MGRNLRRDNLPEGRNWWEIKHKEKGVRDKGLYPLSKEQQEKQ
jgi:hypothetical protein